MRNLVPDLIRIVDDDPSVCASLTFILQIAGFDVVSYNSADQFLEQATDLRPGCVLLDVKMPGMDGLEATRQIRTFDPSVPIVAVTAFAYDRDRQKALDAGASEYLSKPLNGERLRQTLRELLSEE